MRKPEELVPSDCGRRMRLARELAGVPARALSLAAGASPSIVNQIEIGRVESPSANLLNAIAGLLGISLDWLVTGRGKGPSERQVRGALERVQAANRRTETEG